MTPDHPITLRLKNGEQITFSTEEMAHRNFQSGWHAAEREEGSLFLNVRGKIGHGAHEALKHNKYLETSMTAAKIHKLFAIKKA